MGRGRLFEYPICCTLNHDDCSDFLEERPACSFAECANVYCGKPGSIEQLPSSVVTGYDPAGKLHLTASDSATKTWQ